MYSIVQVFVLPGMLQLSSIKIGKDNLNKGRQKLSQGIVHPLLVSTSAPLQLEMTTQIIWMTGQLGHIYDQHMDRKGKCRIYPRRRLITVAQTE